MRDDQPMRWLALLCLIPAHLPGAAPCTAKDLEKLSSGVFWLVTYPGAKSEAGHQFPGLTSYVTPKYTVAACESHWTGVIAAKFTVNESGSVASVKVDNDPGHGMGDAVERALTTWRFTPALVNGRASGMEALAEFDFASREGHLSAPVPLQKYSPEEPEHASKRPPGPLVLTLLIDEVGRPQNV